MKKVNIKEVMMTIPTYPIGEPNKNPMFLEKRVYQGSSGKVYPYPVIEKIYDEKIDQEYKMIVIENDYIEVWIMPELGGRIQRARDKTNNYDFVYYNHVIKPALVGLVGPWISGGIEFNWPQHHRPNTYGDVEYKLIENNDDSKSVYVSEIDKMYGTKVTTSFTLFPDSSYIKIDSILYNSTDLPQTFLWWANPAVPVNDYTQSIFPVDVHAVLDHGKRDVSTFPIATGEYYKVDYSAGVDISRYKNIPVPTSYMAYKSDFDFVGNYDYQKKAGLLHVASHHISPGKKQWTWGNGDFGKAWDRNLTDEDGPYIELMTGVFTDNQPDFTWLLPNEKKEFTQYFLPYREVGAVKNANINAVINAECVEENLNIIIYTTKAYNNALLCVEIDNDILLAEKVTIAPDNAYIKCLKDVGEEKLKITLYDENGEKIISYEPLINDKVEIPEPAKPIGKPSELETVEDLYIAGMHLEQYRHATREPAEYYLEGLKRSETDIRINNAYGLLLFRRGQIKQSVHHFKKAIAKASSHNTRLYDGDPMLNLGISLFYLDKLKEAYDALYKATWSANTKSNAYYYLALIDSRRNDFSLALEHLDKCLATNNHHLNARNLKITLLRINGNIELAKNFACDTRSIDNLNHQTEYEISLLQIENTNISLLLNYSAANYLNLSNMYAIAGLYDEAIKIVNEALIFAKNPLLYYYLGYFYIIKNDYEKAKIAYNEAINQSLDYCYPNKLMDIIVLEKACEVNPTDAKAYYLLGNIWYDKKQDSEAIENWEKSAILDNSFPTVFRNLSLAYFNKKGDVKKSTKALEKAFELNKNDARVFFELDQLYKKNSVSYKTRLELMEKNIDLVNERDDLYVEYLTVLNLNHMFELVIEKALLRNFHPWEGGEGKIMAQYVVALIESGKNKISQNSYDEAIITFEKAFEYPLNFAEGKLYGAQENNKNYYLGCAYQMLQNKEKEKEKFELASVGLDNPSSSMYYNDQPPEMIFYKGLALQKLGKEEKANEVFTSLVNYGKEHMNDHVTIDYFAISLPDFLVFEEDLDRKNQIHCLYMMALGYIGFGEKEKMNECLIKIIDFDNSHLGANILLYNENKYNQDF